MAWLMSICFMLFSKIKKQKKKKVQMQFFKIHVVYQLNNQFSELNGTQTETTNRIFRLNLI